MEGVCVFRLCDGDEEMVVWYVIEGKSEPEVIDNQRVVK